MVPATRLALTVMCKDTSGFKQMTQSANNDAIKLWPNSLVMLGLVPAHIIVNRKLVSLGVAPVGTDPCDGVNLFAFFTIVFIAIGSTPRLFNSHYSSSPLRYLYVVRSQLAVLFAIFITFAAEIVALMRDPTAWIRTVLPSRLVALVCALAVVTVAAMLLIMFTQRNRISLSALRWTRTILPVVVATVGLAVCPEWPTFSPSRTAHILTVALGALVVFIPMRLLLPEIVLNETNVHRERTTFGAARERTLLLVGVAVLLFSFFEHVPILARDIVQLFVAYALLGAPLGFAGRLRDSVQDAHSDK